MSEPVSRTFSVTEVGTFKRCRRLWWYTSPSLCSLGPLAPQKALSLGTTVHNALAQWLQEPSANLRDLFAVAAAEDRLRIEKAYRAKVGANISEEELAPFHEGVDLGLHMMANYQQKWTTPLFDGFELVQSEMRLELPVEGTPHKLLARFDAIIRQTRTGDLMVLEHKTYSARPRLPGLQQNTQFLAYVWAAQQLGIGKVVGIAYSGMWKRPAPPRGSVFDDLFLRVLITRPQYEIDTFGQQIAHDLNEMARAIDDPATMNDINRRWETCYDDQGFEALCTLQSRGEDWEHYRDTHYQRLDADKNAVAVDDND